MNYLIAGLAKSGTTMLFSRIQRALGPGLATHFEPDQDNQLTEILFPGSAGDSLTKVLIGRVSADNSQLREFDRHVLIYRDPRDQFVSMLLYLFYDFQVSSDQAGFDACYAALEKKCQDPEGVSAIGLYNKVAECVGRAPVAVFNNLHKVQKEYIDKFSPHSACYEDLLDGKWAPLEAYLGVPLTTDAAVPVEYTRVVRSKGYGDWRLWLNAADIEYTNAQWGESITALGYALGEPNVHQEIAAETTTDYVRQFDPRLNQAPS